MEGIDVASLDFANDAVAYTCAESLEGSGKGNVYVCLQCGRFLVGRVVSTPLFDHHVSTEHSLCMNVSSLHIYDLAASATRPFDPDAVASSLQLLTVIRENIKPSRFSLENACMQDSLGTSYMRGLVGLSGAASSLTKACIQLVCHVEPFRGLLLAADPAVTPLRRLARLMWLEAPLLRTPLVCSHIPSVSDRSSSRDAFLGIAAGVGPEGALGSLQGTVRIARKAKTSPDLQTATQTFRCLSVDLPPMPVFMDAVSGKLPIPQAHLRDLIGQKFNSGVLFFDAKGNGTAYDLLSLPATLLISISGRPDNTTTLLFDSEDLRVADLSGMMAHYRLGGMICFDRMQQRFVCIVPSSAERGMKREWFKLDEQSVSTIANAGDALLIAGDVHLQMWHRR